MELASLLRDRGLRVTPQRLVIYEAILSLDRHLTADDLIEAVEHILPTVSPPTIYATLDLLVEMGLVRTIGMQDRATLYEPRIDGHHHSVCRSCGRVTDLDLDLDLTSILREAWTAGFEPRSAELTVAGHCARCPDGDASDGKPGAEATG